MQSTNYGSRRKGSSPFVIVAPHAAGDDLWTGEVAMNLSKHLNAFVIINEKYIKHTNSRAKEYPEKIEDFNNLDFCHTESKYLWESKHSHMREFYEHLDEFCESARCHGEGESITVFIHGMKDNEKDIGIDIGFGVKFFEEKIKDVENLENKHLEVGDNTGKIVARVEDILRIKENLEKELIEDHGLKVGMGEFYAGESVENGVQHHFNFPGYSLQMEIVRSLRKSHNIEYTSKLIADALKKTYGDFN